MKSKRGPNRSAPAARAARDLALAAVRIDTAPAERWQHGPTMALPVAPRFPTSVASGLACLRRSHAIGDAEVAAGERFQRDWVWGIEGVRDAVEGPGGSSDAHDAQLARCEAVSCVRAVEDVIGSGLVAWLVQFLVNDLSFTAMASKFLSGRANGRIEMRGRVAAILTVLSETYRGLDARRRQPTRERERQAA